MKQNAGSSLLIREPGFLDEFYYWYLCNRVLGGPRLGKLIASGGTGRVYRLENTKKERAVVKIVDTQMIHPDYRERLCRHCEYEMDLLSRMSECNDNIMPLLNEDICRSCKDQHCARCPLGAGRPLPRLLRRPDWDEEYCRIYFLVMPELTPLRQFFGKNRNLSNIEPLKVGMDICKALQACYAEPDDVIHRDVKPDNIFVREEKNGKHYYVLGDFGIARPLGNGVMTGFCTREYAAPEMRSGVAVKNSDLYSVGVTLYELAGGQFDINEMAMHELGPENSHLCWDSFRPAVQGLREIIARSLAPYDRRYEQPQDMYDELEDLYLDYRVRYRCGQTGADGVNSGWKKPPVYDPVRDSNAERGGPELVKIHRTAQESGNESPRETTKSLSEPECLRRIKEYMLAGDFAAAAEWAGKGSDLGSRSCGILLAYCRIHEIRRGKLDELYRDSAVRALEEAAECGDPAACYLAATLAFEAGDPDRFLMLLQTSAQKDFPIARYTYGRGLYEGAAPMQEDAVKGWEHLYRAAKAGHIGAIRYCRKVLEKHPNMEGREAILQLQSQTAAEDPAGVRKNTIHMLFRGLGFRE